MNQSHGLEVFMDLLLKKTRHQIAPQFMNSLRSNTEVHGSRHTKWAQSKIITYIHAKATYGICITSYCN